MYLNFYGLTEKPFNLTPDSHFLFLSKKHKEALAHLRYGIQERKGFVLITGEIGAGKTTLCRALLKEMEKEYKIALILNPMLSPTGLLKAIVTDLNIEYKGRTRQDLIQALDRYLIKGNDVVVVIDEAQNLSKTALEQIRLLGNLETENDKLLQLILIGQPELKKHLEKESLKQLKQRIAVRYHIRPLDQDETTFYIFHRLNVSGAAGKIKFKENALEKIFLYSHGVPRIINIICDYALTVGYIEESWIITNKMVERAIREYEGIESYEEVPALA